MNIQISDTPQKNNVKKQNSFLSFISKWFILFFVIFLIIASVVGAYIYTLNTKTSSGTNASLASISNNGLNAAYTTKPIALESPINGAFIDETKFASLDKNKVLAVMIENLAGPNGARPQAGLQDADIVYEAPVEGNITRYMAIFWNNQDTAIKVMPIRSARKYFLDWLSEYGKPVYMHIGQASSDDPNTDALGALTNLGILDLSGGSNAFSRDQKCEAIKAVEHCAYSDTTRLWNIAKNNGWTNIGNIDTLQYKDDKESDSNATTPISANTISVDFIDDPQNYEANWKYDPTTNTYLRSIGTTPHLDQVSGKQIFAKTIVVEQTSVTETNDEKYHKIIKTTGSGNAWVIQDGKATLATWKKADLNTRTKYYDKTTGKELTLDRGKMWITITAKTPVIK